MLERNRIRFVDRWILPLFASLAVWAALSAQSAQAAVISLGTLVPDGTSYHRSLLGMGEEWRKLPRGPRLRIYAGGRLGGEAKMVRQMRLGALDAGLLTAVGLSEIEPAVSGLQSLPLMFRSLEEADYVAERLHPTLEKRLEAKGFVVLFWTDAGWVRFFSKDPIRLPRDLQSMKLFTWAGDPTVVEVWKSAGFNPVPLETANIVPMLDTGLINAVPMPPFVALASQVHTRAPNMLELNWAPLIGALVMRKEAWDSLPAETRQAMRKAAHAAGEENKRLGRAESDKSVLVMKEKGLIVHPVDAQTEAQWRQTAEKFYPQIKGKIVPADVFEEVERLLKEYRSKPNQGAE